MKKFIFTITALVGFTAFGQEIVSKKGHTVLPEEGDFMLGFDAIPVLDFGLNAINIMNDTGNGAKHPGAADETSGGNAMIVGKYFLSSDMAIRGRLAINTSRNVSKQYEDDPMTPSATNPENILLQTTIEGSQEYALAGGIEWRRGHNRLRGFYGGEAFIGIGNSRTVNEYEIEWDSTAEDSSVVSAPDSRLLKNKSGTSITLGLRGFVGVEYFILPKISIGAEFGWSLGMVTDPRGTEEKEYWGIEPGSGATENSSYIGELDGDTQNPNSYSMTDLGNPFGAGTAALTLNFHF